MCPKLTALLQLHQYFTLLLESFAYTYVCHGCVLPESYCSASRFHPNTVIQSCSCPFFLFLGKVGLCLEAPAIDCSIQAAHATTTAYTQYPLEAKRILFVTHSLRIAFSVCFQLEEYEKETGINLVEHPLAVQLESCNSIDSITDVLQERV